MTWTVNSAEGYVARTNESIVVTVFAVIDVVVGAAAPTVKSPEPNSDEPLMVLMLVALTNVACLASICV